MTGIVIAYAPADLKAADRMAAKLESLGFQVTREVAGPRRTARRAPFLRGRDASAPVIVLWSRHYARARRRGSALMAARLDASPLSFPMKTRAVDLRAWRGREDHRGWRALLAGLGVKPPRAPAEPEKKSSGAAILLWIAGFAAAAGGAAALFVVR
jgi:hypothetical protein